MPPPRPLLDVGRIASLRRYPVKSVAGQPLERVLVETRGVQGDRLWSVRDADGKLGSGKSTRRFRKMDGLLALAAHYDGETPVIEFPDGRRLRGDDPAVHDALSRHVGRPVTLAREDRVSHFDDGPVHLVTTSSLSLVGRAHGHDVDLRRLRPNLLLDTGTEAGFVEETWVGRRITIGEDLQLEIRAPMPRCVMVNLPQTGLPPEPGLLATLTGLNRAQVGVVADVLAPGAVAVGDTARLAR